ncbi:hypothetical protein [Corynebacterium sp. LK2510]|uniref:hypothetical protein n=1 Tax=Corynebacterium sp. LK2510 TaxID=3110472 RepID=UPI0034CE265A
MFTDKKSLHSPAADPTAHRATDLAYDIARSHPATVEALRGIIRHPRSLSRSTATWRPPIKALPRLGLGDDLTVAVTRRRVGPRARARIQGYGEKLAPSYLIELRITDRTGLPVDPRLSEAWVRAVLDEDSVDAVHEIPAPRSVTYVWLVDATYTPVLSPSSMFAGLTAA